MDRAVLQIIKGVREPKKPWFPAPTPEKEIPISLNPKDLKVSGSSKWGQGSGKGKGGHAEYLGAERRTLSFELLLDAVEFLEVAWLSDDIADLFACLAPREDTKKNKSPSPSFIRLIWGPTSFTGTLQKVDVTYTMFSSEGDPLRARVALSIKEYEAAASESKPQTRQNPTSGAIRSFRRRVLGRGQSLAHLADAEYGVPGYWRAIAAFNEIDDPMRVETGAEILIPDRADVPGLMSP